MLLSFVGKVNGFNQKLSQEFYLVKLKGFGTLGPKLNAASQTSPPPPSQKKKKIGQFVSSCRKGYKFHILLLSFVWKVSWLNQKTFTGVSVCDSEGPCKHWAKTECCFPNKPPKNWSICFELTNKVQIWHFIGMFCLKHKLIEAKLFTRLLFCDTEGPWNVWVETE